MKHIVSFVGSYMITRRPTHEIGLLMWPVAPCDLHRFLQSLSTIVDASKQTRISFEEDTLDDLKLLSEVTGSDYKPGSPHDSAVTFSREQCQNLIQKCLQYLQHSLGCLAKAMEHLHQECIRYRSMKPHNVLLCTDGPYLCDFDSAWDYSFQGQSITENQAFTRKYASPECLNLSPCGRPDDVFSLGLVFLEVGQHLIMRRLPTNVPFFSLSSDLERPFIFAEHLEEIDGWLGQFITATATDIPMSEMSLRDAQSVGRGQPESLRALAELIRQMLKRNPNERPSMQDVVGVLSEAPFASQDASGVDNSFFGACCMPK